MLKLNIFKWLEKIQIITFLLLSFFPILKFNHSSILLIAFFSTSIILFNDGFKERLKTIPSKYFLLHAGAYLMLLLSLLYSSNIKEGVDRIVQFMPLLLTPITIIYFNPISIKKYIPYFLSLFLVANIIYGYIVVDYLIVNYVKEVNEKGFLEIIRILYESNFNTALWHSEQAAESDILIHKAYLSISFLMCFCICISRILDIGFKKIQYWGYLFLASVFFISVVYLLSIPNILGLIGCLLLIVLINYTRIGKKNVLVLGGLLLVLSSIGYYYVIIKEANNKDLNRGVNFIKSAISFSDTEYNDPRVELYKSAWTLVKKHPLFGVGIGDTQDRLKETHIKRLEKYISQNKNELKLGEEFDNDIWYKGNSQVIKNFAAAPDQSLTADKLTDNKVNFGHNISQTFHFENNETYSFSIFAKSMGCDYVIMRLGDISNQRVSFNLPKGTIDYKGKLIIDAGIKEVGSGWYRCHLTTEVSGKQLGLIGVSTGSGVYNYEGKGDSILLWGAQLEKGEVSSYKKNSTELLQYAIKEDLNTHNNYLFFYLSGGLFCLLIFVASLINLGWKSFMEKKYLCVSFIVILVINLLSENVLSRHFGLMFYSVFFITLFSENFKKNQI